jgi:hypothetical protein
MRMEDVHFLIIGATKSATTWLQQSLQQHPSIDMPDPELHYFSREYDRGPEWYLSHFAGLDGQVRGEKSNSYMDTPAAFDRIRHDLSHVKLIAQLRNPIERAYSDYCMLYRRGEVGADIARYLDPRTGEGGRFLNGGLYHDQLRPFLDAFGEGKLTVLLYESILTEPQRQLDTVAAFLGLDDRLRQPAVKTRVKDRTQQVVGPGMRKLVHSIKGLVRPFRNTAAFRAARGLIARELRYPALDNDLRLRLVEYYLPQIEKMGQLHGPDFSIWLDAKSTPPRN